MQQQFELIEEESFTIVLVDDSPLVHKIVKRVLEKKYEVKSCFTGREAIEQMEVLAPSLILLDVEMPDMDGFEAIKLLRGMPSLANVPIIFLTAKNDVAFEVEALGLGAVDYINKPFADELLQKRVEIHLAHAVQQRTLTHYNENLENMIQEKTKIIKELQYAIIYTLVDLVEMRDNSTGGHIQRTQAYYKLILDYLETHKIYQHELHRIEKHLLLEAAQLHDIGKVAIPDAILCKPARLTPEEFEVMKTHTTIGYKAIMNAMKLTTEKDFLSFAAPVALYHHEKWNGNGYPSGLAGEEIPIAARIMSIVDVYDALVSERHYKKKMTHEQAMEILANGRGTDFDPVLIDAVFAMSSEFEEISQTPFEGIAV